MKYFLKVLFVVFSITFILVNWKARGTGDVEIWMRWMTDARNYGLIEGYIKSVSDYPIGSHLVLNLFGYFQKYDTFSLVKLSILLSFVIWWITFIVIGRHFKLSVIDSSVLALNPALILNSIFLSYLDIRLLLLTPVLQ